MANKKASADTVRTGIEEITTQGDLLYRGASDLERLPKGTAAQVLKMNSGATAPEWGADEGLPAAGTSGNVLTSDGSAWNSTAAGGFTLKGEPVATTSGTNIDISGFPAGISMMVVGFMGISCVSTVDMQFQMGTASGLVSSSGPYTWSVSAELRESIDTDMIDSSSSFPINANWHGHTFVYDGQMILTRMSTASDTWTASWNVSASKSSYFQLSAGAGRVALGGEFTQIRLRNGGHNFDAGSVNFAYLL